MNFLSNSLSFLLVVSCYFLAEAQTCGHYGSNRIVGGDYASHEDWPWQARLKISVGRSSFVCGGTLISANKVLSAAHCFIGEPNEKLSKVDVIFGDADLEWKEGTEVTISVPASNVSFTNISDTIITRYPD
jgi:secreted trypsin-like serine protease